MKEAGCACSSSAMNPAINRFSKYQEGATVERARQFTKDCHKLGLVVHGDFILGLPESLAKPSRTPSTSPRNSTWRRFRFPSLTPTRNRTTRIRHEEWLHHGRQQNVDDGGHQMVQIEYPPAAAKFWRPFTTSTTPITSVPKLRTAF